MTIDQTVDPDNPQPRPVSPVQVRASDAPGQTWR